AIVAGIVKMPFWPFQIANWTASAAWGFSLLYGAGRLAEFMTR
ncbi:MAG: DedA family protein, partial [Rhodocyclaceae bacterium]|nr:DedA family protein [Rhodocyclaceae bacterium]